ncbi:unnamed protein product [Allacma fusca]|uniref:Chitin-binding type-2 domain-containing protein n=1 Tax=Allacma fusca TaxID=39272 RepID=A0A8J2KK66_9HEXA|nr:unnamed protein product [Allacma fusca]
MNKHLVFLGVATLLVPLVLGLSCKRAGFFPHETNSTKYYMCQQLSPNVFAKYEYTCSDGQIFTDPPGNCHAETNTTESTRPRLFLKSFFDRVIL